MAHAYYHACSSARKFGGVWQDYLSLHLYMDHTKGHIADARHRMLLHNSWGIFLVEKIFGVLWIRESDGKQVPTRAILEQHVLEDLGFIPSLEQCFHNLPLEEWMFEKAKKLSRVKENEDGSFERTTQEDTRGITNPV